MSTQLMPVEVFCASAHEDEDWLRKLETHLSLLKQQGLISLWHDRLISPGTDRMKEIDAHLERASVILLLVSADFFTSDYCSGIKLERTLERGKMGDVRVLPILVRPVEWGNAPFAQLQVLPSDGRPITLWEDLDAAFANVVAGIICAIKDLNGFMMNVSSRREAFLPLNRARHVSSPNNQRWLQPPRPILDKAFVGRKELLERLIKDLTDDKNITSVGIATTLTLQGMGGVGKTYLALKLASELYDYFPGGVIRLNCGPQINNETDAQILLSKLASYSFGGLPPNVQFYPDQVAAWLEEEAPGRLLVIFDDVWDSMLLRILNSALPPSAVRLITTRSVNIAQTLKGKTIHLEYFSPQESLAFLENRLDCQGDTAYRGSLEALTTLLGGHALSLDIIAARIKKPMRAKLILEDLQNGIGQEILDGLKLPPSEAREDNLEISLALSYAHMTRKQQNCFRALGIFAPGIPITVEAVAAVWHTSYFDHEVEALLGLIDLAPAKHTLCDLADLAMLDEIEDITNTSTTYLQHSLLHAYAHALMLQAGELASASFTHAKYYTDFAYHIAISTPINYSLLDQQIQNLLTALQWAADNQSYLLPSLLEALSQFLRSRGQITFLEEYLPKALIKANSSMQQANLLMNLGQLDNKLGYLDRARDEYEASLSLYQEMDECSGEANALCCLGYLEHQLSNFDQAKIHYDTALSLYRSELNQQGEANVLSRYGDMFLIQKRWRQAQDYYEQALPLFVSRSDLLGQAHALIGLGQARFELGDHNQGMRDVQRATTLYHSVEEKEWENYAKQRLVDMQATDKNQI